jgi:serine/threonine-protein kinase
MARDPRVARLLEELLDTNVTPEEVCRGCPELLPEVRAGWRRLAAVQFQVGLLFPPPSPVPDTAFGPPGSSGQASDTE